MRPYMDDFWDRSETEMMPLEDRIQKAEGGDKFAIAKLATAYLNGDDEVEQNPEKAAYWYRKEAELGESEGAFNLGLLYAKGFGVKRDFAQAAEWMEKAVAWGDEDGKAPAAQYRAMAESLKRAEAGDAAVDEDRTDLSGDLPVPRVRGCKARGCDRGRGVRGTIRPARGTAGQDDLRVPKAQQ